MVVIITQSYKDLSSTVLKKGEPIMVNVFGHSRQQTGNTSLIMLKILLSMSEFGHPDMTFTVDCTLNTNYLLVDYGNPKRPGNYPSSIISLKKFNTCHILQMHFVHNLHAQFELNHAKFTHIREDISHIIQLSTLPFSDTPVN